MAETKTWPWANDPTLNRVELLKLEKDGLDIIDTIVNKYAKEGFASIHPDDFDRFKWAGVYQQRPKQGHFMMRDRKSVV